MRLSLKIFIIFYLKNLQGAKNDQDIIIIPRKHLPEDLFLTKPSFSYLSRWLLRSGDVIGEQGSKHGGERRGSHHVQRSLD